MKTPVFPLALVLLSSLSAVAHDWHRHEDPQLANLQALTDTNASGAQNFYRVVGTSP